MIRPLIRKVERLRYGREAGAYRYLSRQGIESRVGEEQLHKYCVKYFFYIIMNFQPKHFLKIVTDGGIENNILRRGIVQSVN